MKGRIQISDKIKGELSLILKYYRKRSNLNQRDFITYNGATICSADTYSRIENQKIIKSHSIYIYLLYQIDAGYEFLPLFWEAYQPLFEDLLTAVTRYELREVARIAGRIQEKLPNSKDIYVKEVRLLMDIIPDYYENCSELSQENYDKYLSLYTIFASPLQEIIKDMLYTYTVHRERSVDECRRIFEQLEMEKSSCSLNILNRSYQYFYEERFLDCFRDSLYLEDLFLKDNNYNRLLDVYDAIVLLYTAVQQDKGIHEYDDKLFTLVREHAEDFHPNKYRQSLFQCGMLLYEQHHDLDAYPYFSKLAGIDDYHYLPAALIANFIASRHHFEPDPILLNEPKLPERFPPRILAFHRYFIKKANGCSCDELEIFLVKEVLPLIDKDDNVCWNPLIFELDSLVKVTKHYYQKKKLAKN